MIIKNIYEKKLPIMNNKILKYNLCEGEEGNRTNYGIQLTEDTDKIHREEIIWDISSDKNFVNNLLMYLSENVIDTVHFRDIIEDYIQADF